VALIERPSIPSSGGGLPLAGQAAAKHAVITPRSADGASNREAAALLEYSATTNSSATSFVRCQPMIRPLERPGTIT